MLSARDGDTQTESPNLSGDERKQERSRHRVTPRKTAPSDSSLPPPPHKKPSASRIPEGKEEKEIFNARTEKAFFAAQAAIQSIENRPYPKAVASFLQFVRAFTTDPATQSNLLNDPGTVKKVTEEMIIKFFNSKKRLHSGLADAFILEGITENDLQYFDIILLDRNVQNLLKEKSNDKVKLLKTDIDRLCSDIRIKLVNTDNADNKRPERDMSVRTILLSKKSKSKTNMAAPVPPLSFGTPPQTEQSSQPSNTPDTPNKKKKSDHAKSTRSPHTSSSSQSTPRHIFIYNNATQRNDEKIDVILKNVEEQLEKLKVKARNDPLQADVYYAVDNLYNRCRMRIIEQQRDKMGALKDPKHKLILQSNEVKLLERVDDLLTAVYDTPFDYNSASEKQFKDHINTKRAELAKYESVCKQTGLGTTLGKVAIAVAIAVGVTLACVALGTLIGALVFAWTGPGALITAVKGGLLGGSIGWTVGLSTAAAVTGVATSTIVSKFWLFKDSKLQRSVNDVAENVDKVITKEAMLKTAP